MLSQYENYILQHALDRLGYRNFTKRLINEIVKNPDDLFFDKVQKSYVAVGTRKYNLKIKKIAVFYHYQDQNIVIRTFHIEKEQEIKNRILKGRYIELNDKNIWKKNMTNPQILCGLY